jgi:phage baseplate assembly protein V
LSDTRERVMNMMVHAVVEATNDAHGVQQHDVSMLHDEAKAGVERFQNYGFSSVPLPGAEAIMMFFGGARDNGKIVAVDHRTVRLRGLAGGEVAIYTDEGDTIILKRGRRIEIQTTQVKITAPGGVLVTGDVIADCDGTKISLMHHRHKDTQPGGGQSGVPLPTP